MNDINDMYSMNGDINAINTNDDNNNRKMSRPSSASALEGKRKSKHHQEYRIIPIYTEIN